MSMILVRGMFAAVVLAAPLLAGAKGGADAAMGRFVLPCDRAGSTDAVYACALTKAVEAGVVRAQVVQACRDDQGTVPLDKPNQEAWHCAGLRQFGPEMPDKEWRSATARDCQARSRRPGHRYAGQENQCIADAIIEQRRVPDAAVSACRSQPGIEKSHRLLNCLGKAMGQQSSMAPPTTHIANAADIVLVQSSGQGGARPSWKERIQAIQAEDASSGRLSQEAYRDDAQYPPQRVRDDNRNYCESNNRSGALAHDCACVLREVDRHLAQGRLPRKTIAHHQFDWSPCIDRARSADKYVAKNFTPGLEQMMRRGGVDVEAYKACQHRAIAQDIPLASLTSWDYVRSEIKRLCSQGKSARR